MEFGVGVIGATGYIGTPYRQEIRESSGDIKIVALCARRRDLLWQILAESVILSVSGGLIGTLLGFGVAIGLSSLTPVAAVVHPWSIVLGISMTAAVGLFFGLYPASRAAALDPISALGRA